MSLSDALRTARPPEIVAAVTPTPKGWERGVSWQGTDGTVTTGPIDTEVNAAVWKELIADWGLDSDSVEIIDGSVKFKGWDSPIAGGNGATVRLRSYSARVQHRAAANAEHMADVEALCRVASKKNPPRKPPPPVEGAERAMLVALADFQLGKGEGDGSEGTVNRISAATARVLQRLADFKKLGRPFHVVYLVGLGDLVEGCSGHYAMQTWSVDLTRRDQLKVVRRLILQMVDDITDAGYRIVLSGVAGNHGENRNASGKAFTDWEDNDDLAVIEQVGEILAANPERYSGVSVYLPEMLSMTLDVCGVNVGFAHGHQIRGGANGAMNKIEKWWLDQIGGNQPTAAAKILVTGHFHHFVCSEGGIGGRTHFQCPAMDPGSRWFTESSGKYSPAGLLTLGVGSAYGERGYGDVEIL